MYDISKSAQTSFCGHSFCVLRVTRMAEGRITLLRQRTNREILHIIARFKCVHLRAVALIKIDLKKKKRSRTVRFIVFNFSIQTHQSECKKWSQFDSLYYNELFRVLYAQTTVEKKHK